MKKEKEVLTQVLFTDYFQSFSVSIKKPLTYRTYSEALMFFRDYEATLGRHLYCDEINKGHLKDFAKMMRNKSYTSYYSYLLRDAIKDAHDYFIALTAGENITIENTYRSLG